MLKAVVDSLTQLRTEYYSHVANFVTLRRNFNLTDNAIEKFFGKKNIKPEEIKTILTDITTNQQKFTDDIADIYSHLGVWVDPNPVTATIANIKQDITDIKTITDKVKTSHDAKDIKSLSYVIDHGVKDWVSPNIDDIERDNDDRELYSSIHLNKIQLIGIYRFTVISEHRFNIGVERGDNRQGVNTIIMFIEGYLDSRTIFIKPVDPTVVRASVRWILEYLSPI